MTADANRRVPRTSGWPTYCLIRSMAISDRGFASMPAKKQAEIASKGGKAAHRLGVAHEWTPEEARVAGSKGGAATRHRRQARMKAKAASKDDETPGGTSA